MQVSVLMYHAVVDSTAELLGADPHYAVPTAAFSAHLDVIADSGRPVVDVATLAEGHAATVGQAVAITFDDGHMSNLAAARLLAARGWPATFFVNPAQVGERGLLDWAQLAEMKALGMSIQSHGHHHCFLNDLTPAEVRAELADSREALRQHLGEPATVFAPPGGRMADGLAQVAEHLGYRVLCTSEAGVWRGDRHPAMAVPRFAVLASTSTAQLQRWVTADASELRRQRVRFMVLRAAKRLLGNERYVRWRARALGEGEAA